MRTYFIALLSSVIAASAAACGSSGETPGSTGDGGSPPAGASGGTGGNDDTCALLPANIDEDTTVGPGCVRLERTWVRNADLTIAPGTTVLVESAGFLAIGGASGSSSLIAKGTEDEPIVFKSAAASPAPGDWQCVHFGTGAQASEIEHVTFEHGGQPCEVTGAKERATLVVTAPVRAITQVTVKDSQNHGIFVGVGGEVRTFEQNTFSGNGQPSILIALPQLLSLGAPNTFLDDDDVIEIDGRSALDSDGVWRKQAVPFRSSGVAIRPGNEVTIEAGTRIEMTGGSIDAFSATLNIAGTEEEPVVITSAQATPQAGDWGCVVYTSASELTPRIEHVVIEYGGGGQGCTGANEATLLWVPPNARITGSVFRYSEGTAIKCSGACDTEAWCANTFEEIASGPLECGTSNEETTCPVDP